MTIARVHRVEVDGAAQGRPLRRGAPPASAPAAAALARPRCGHALVSTGTMTTARPRRCPGRPAAASELPLLRGLSPALFDLPIRLPGGFLAIEHLNRLARHDRGYGMLVDELRMSVAAKQHAEIVERSDHPGQFDAVDQEYRERILALADRIQKQVLQILRSFRHCSFLSPIPWCAKSSAPN